MRVPALWALFRAGVQSRGHDNLLEVNHGSIATR
jgi:hypothetical protein